METIEKKSKELTKLLQLDCNSVSNYVQRMKESGYSDEEIIIIINHFMNGGMLSEIIAPPKTSTVRDPIISLQDFDLFFSIRKNQLPGLNDKLIEKWAKSKNK